MFTIENIRNLARDCFDSGTMRPTRGASAHWEMISIMNHQELKDKRIAELLCDSRHCLTVRAAAVVRRCDELLGAA